METKELNSSKRGRCTSKNKEFNDALFLRLEKYVLSRGENLFQLTVVIGLSPSYFSGVKKSSSAIGADILSKIVQYYTDLSADWLLTGQGSMLKGNSKTKDLLKYKDRMATIKELKSDLAIQMAKLKKMQENLAKLQN